MTGNEARQKFIDYFKAGCTILQGSAILLHKDHEPVDFFKNRPHSQNPVLAQTIPWYLPEAGPEFYQGNRDTEPRSLLLTRIKIKPDNKPGIIGKREDGHITSDLLCDMLDIVSELFKQTLMK